jgi:hypothetical protein
MLKNKLFVLLLLFPFLLYAQVDNLNTEETEEDFEKYANLSI